MKNFDGLFFQNKEGIPFKRLSSFTLAILFLFFFENILFAQNEITVYQSQTAMTVDGVLDEAVWERAVAVSGFTKSLPIDTGAATFQTEVKMAFDDKNLYVGAITRQPRSTYTVQSFKRDYSGGSSDAFNVSLDPFRDGLNGFVFSVSPLGVQREALVFNGQDLSIEWDNKWRVEVTNFDDYWVLEMAIPFSTLRYKPVKGENRWGVNFIRTSIHPWEVSTWARVPRPFSTTNLGYCNTMVWENPPPPTGKNISLIPYVSGNAGRIFERDENTFDLLNTSNPRNANIGGDAKVAITPSLNLDLTINPDFSQVEVDQQVANLSRFELFFPERRQFFLENRDLFAFFGFPTTRPFFSRRIGLAYNPVTETFDQTPILAGARLSGKLNKDWRIGLINMQTKRQDYDEENVLPAANFGMLALQRKVFARSALQAVFVNKQNFIGGLNDVQKEDWNSNSQVAGLEFNLYSKDNRWEGEWYYHRSFSPREDQRDQVFAQFLGYSRRNYSLRCGYNYIGENYYAEAGFVPRTGIQGTFLSGNLQQFPKWKSTFGSKVNRYGWGANVNYTHDLDLNMTDRSFYTGPSIDFKDNSSFSVGYYYDFTYLFDSFDPTNLYREGDEELPAESSYNYGGLAVDFNSSPSYDVQGDFGLRVGEYFNGNYLSVNGNFTYRLQPYGTFSLRAIYNNIRLPEPYATADFWVVGPRAELAFSKKFFFSTFFQYNTQSNNFNINSRIQYRFAPVSDIFLVYTDNSFAQNVANTEARFFVPKNRTLVLKAVYWLNM